MIFCDEILDTVEAIAAGDLTSDQQTLAHLRSCAGCKAALETARQVDRLLQARPVPVAPPQFTARTLARVRRERWRQEQFFDLGFNLVMGVVLIVILLAAWSFMDLSGLSTLGADTVHAIGSQIAALARTLAPSVLGYAAATALLGALLGVWWWAERRVRY